MLIAHSARCSSITPGMLKDPYRVPGIKPQFCKASALPMLNLSDHNILFFFKFCLLVIFHNPVFLKETLEI